MTTVKVPNVRETVSSHLFSEKHSGHKQKFLRNDILSRYSLTVLKAFLGDL